MFLALELSLFDLTEKGFMSSNKPANTFLLLVFGFFVLVLFCCFFLFVFCFFGNDGEPLLVQP